MRTVLCKYVVETLRISTQQQLVTRVIPSNNWTIFFLLFHNWRQSITLNKSNINLVSKYFYCSHLIFRHHYSLVLSPFTSKVTGSIISEAFSMSLIFSGDFSTQNTCENSRCQCSVERRWFSLGAPVSSLDRVD